MTTMADRNDPVRHAPSARRAGPPLPPPPSALIRQAIGIARVLGILGIVYVHAWTGRTAEELEALDRTAQGLLRWSLIELVGRSAVPLLGAVSGWLVGASALKRGYCRFVAVKARTILVPMLLWNAIAMVMICSLAIWGSLKAPIPDSPAEAIDWWLCLSGPNPINVQIYFLRDLFVCMLAAPLLARAGVGWLWAVAIVALGWSVLGESFPLLLRPPILVFFVGGMLARRYGMVDRIARWRLASCVAPYLLLVPCMIWLSSFGEPWLLAHARRAHAIDLVVRVAAALALCRIALELAPTRAGRILLAGERYAFLLFCCHMLLIWQGGPLMGLVTGPLGSPAYPVQLLLEPVLVLIPTILIGRALVMLSPALAGILSGGRLASPPRPASPQP